MSTAAPPPTATLERYLAALRAGDADAFAAQLAPGVVLHSPITARTRFEGREHVRLLMRHVFATLEDLEVVSVIGEGRERAIFVRARIGRQEVEEVALLTLDDDGLVAELRIWFRPLPGLTALMGTLGPKLARERSRTRAVAAKAMTGPLVGATRMGDAVAVKLIPPAPGA